MLAAVVAALTMTVRDAPAARVPKLQVRTLELMEQLAAPVPPVIVQVSVPGAVGRLSVRPAPFSWPSPTFLAVIVKVAVAPATMVPLPVLVTVMSPQSSLRQSSRLIMSLARACVVEVFQPRTMEFAAAWTCAMVLEPVRLYGLAARLAGMVQPTELIVLLL